MALNLAVKEGYSVYVDDRPIKVVSVEQESDTWVVFVEDDEGNEYELGEDHEVQIYPSVYVHLGLKNQIGMASLVFEAPKEVVILTEKNYALQAQSRR